MQDCGSCETTEQSVSLFAIQQGTKSRLVHACMIRGWTLAPAKHEKVAIYAINLRISNVCRIAEVVKQRSNPYHCLQFSKEGIIMIQIFKRNKKITKLFLLLFFLCCTAFLLIFYIESDKPITKKKQTAAKTTADKPTSISYCVTSLSDEEESTLIYHPTERVLSQFIRKKNQYIRNIWDEKSGWTTNVESWKIKESETLEQFSYNTNGALYACKKKWSKGKLAKQSIVCLRNNGNIKNINLIHLNNKQNTDEIKDIRCNGTSIAITYQYGNVTIYNLLERLAFGGGSISGMPGENIFYNLHYLTIETKKTTEEIYLRDYDIRSGEVTHTFPLGSFAQKKEDFHITNLGNTLYVLTPRGLFRGECESSSLQKLLAFRELQLPPQSNILTMFSGSADSLYLVIKEADGSKSIRLIHLPSQNLSDQNHPESNHATQKV